MQTMMDLINKYNTTQDQYTFSIIFEYYTPLLRSMCNKSFNKTHHNELMDVCKDTLPKALKAYNPTKGSKLTTYIYSYCKRYCTRYIQNLERTILTDEFDPYINKNAPAVDIDLQMDIAELLKNNLTPLEQKIIKMRYGFDGYGIHTFQDINAILNMPSSHYHHNKALQKLRNTEYIKTFKY